MKKLLLLFIFMSLLATACYKNYPEGPKITFRSPNKRLIGTWFVTKYTIDSLDRTSDYEGIRFQFMKSSDSLIIEGNIKSLHEYKVLPGHWRFNNGYSTLTLYNKGIFGDTTGNDFQIEKLSFHAMHLVGGLVDGKNNVHTINYFLQRY